ncbi:hypothetical protein AB0N89_02530 [Amycolatopsis sp. NPDC089917]|uniref:hypothetical protein n=1 Tax=Amycolatopsis sp. NPDC089917 TaxID=3155187 RepID=UPI0034430545
METTADEVRDTFLVTPQAKGVYLSWENNPKRIAHGVVSTMRDHVTKEIYNCTLDTFEWVKENHAHPLEGIKKKDIAHIDLASNWEPDFAFVHLFHLLMEDLGRPPLWSEFDKFAYETDVGLKMFGSERLERQKRIYELELKRLRAEHPTWKGLEHKANALAKGSLDWRVGLAYYGFMREMYTAVALRERGLDVRVHPLADANFRADAWIGQSILSVFVINPKYKVEDQQHAEKFQKGRKKAVEELFPGNLFDFVELTMESAQEYGKFHFPTEASIGEVEGFLRAGSQRT